jgi:cupin fold WbuC family metalloprotein
MKIIDSQLLAAVTEQAKNSPRLRMNYNFHQSMDSNSQRLLNALEMGTELPIHRHQHTAETYILLQGSIKVLFYNEKKELIDSTVLNPLEGKFGIDIPAGQFHTIEILENGSVIFEVKDGPYTPLEEKDILR